MQYLISRLKMLFLGKLLRYLSKNLLFNWYLNPREYISREILSFGHQERDLLEYIFSNIKIDKSDEFIDIGANIGNHSLFFSEYFNKGYSFEPVLSTFKALDLNVCINNLSDRIHVFNEGISSSDGQLTFSESTDGDIGRSMIIDDLSLEISANKIYKIKVSKGDKYFSKCNNIGLIKVDAEGHEVSVIKGLSNTIIKNKPIILFEANAFPDNPDFQDTYKSLSKLGYNFFYSPQIKFYDVKSTIFRNILRVLISSKRVLVRVEEGFSYKSQLTIASFEDIS